MAVEREGRVTTPRGRTRSLHRLTEVGPNQIIFDVNR